MRLPSDRRDDLRHFGIKGMRWGVRKADNASTSSAPSAKEVKALRKARAAKGPEAAFADLAKPDGAADPKVKGWRPTKKQVALIALGAAATGAILYEANTGNISKTIIDLKNKKAESPSKPPIQIKPHSIEDYLAASEAGASSLRRTLNPLGGVKVTPEAYKEATVRSWEQYGETGLSRFHFDRPEEEYPAGHTFFRISTAKEKSFSSATYMLSDAMDVPRYMSRFVPRPGEDGPSHHLISFRATEVIRSPDLKTRLDALHAVMTTDATRPPSPADVLHTYESLTLTRFNGEHAPALFAELKRRGYSAIVDDNNVGIIGESPMVLFNPERVTAKVSEAITPETHDTFTSHLTEIDHRL